MRPHPDGPVGSTPEEGPFLERPATAARFCLYMQPFGCIMGAMRQRDGRVFDALADGTRRGLLDRLFERSGQTLGELCAPMRMSRQAVSKHLAILERANLVATHRRGREKLHYLNPVPIHEIQARWIAKFERTRLQALDDLKKQLEEEDR